MASDLTGLTGSVAAENEYDGLAGDESGWQDTLKTITGTASDAVSLLGKVKTIFSNESKVETVTAPQGGSVGAQGATSFTGKTYLIIGGIVVGVMAVGFFLYSMIRKR